MDGGEDFRRDQPGETFEDDQGNRSADDGTRQVKFLQQGDEDTENLPEDQEQRQRAENKYGGHKGSL